MKTDTQLHLDVVAELKWEPSVHASRIVVAVRDGTVTLSGHVGTYLERWNAESAARRVSGVLALVVDVDVKLPLQDRRSDTDIARLALLALAWMKPTQTDSVQLAVEGGWISLSGQVRWQYQKQAATDALRYVVGVTGISNQLTVEPFVVPEERSLVEASLRRRALRDEQTVSITVQGAVVTLQGTVDSWPERQSAVQAAWSLPGVRSVVDHMVQTH